MTAITERANAVMQVERQQLERTFAMTAVGAGWPGGTKTPTVTGVMTIEDLAFIGSPQINDGDVLGLIITNPEDVPHSFDIDSLNIHVQVSPETTTAVVIQPTGPGNLEFYCSVHTHRDRGMVGAISVE